MEIVLVPLYYMNWAYTIYQLYCMTAERSRFNVLFYNMCMPFFQ